MQKRDRISTPRRFFSAALLCIAILSAASCSKKDEGADLRLPEAVYGFYLGETKEEVFERAGTSIRVTRAPDPPLGYRGELYDLSSTIEPRREVERVRCAFLDGRLMEVIVYFRDTSLTNLDWLKMWLEGTYNQTFSVEDPSREMAQKTLRFSVPGMSVTLRRITKRHLTELYAQFLHEELHGRLKERAAKTG